MSSGLFGCFLLFLWMGTDHQSMTNNLNLVWAFPVNLILGFRIKNVSGWLNTYAKIYAVAVLLLLMLALAVPGLIPVACYPLMIALSYRSWLSAKKII
jgi:hypothetical protein